MSTLELKNGKFWKNGKVVPPVFGDPEQIAVLKRIELQATDAAENGIYIEYLGEDDDGDEVYGFNCLCGKPVNIYFLNRLRDNIRCECGLLYSIETGDFQGNIAKLIIEQPA